MGSFLDTALQLLGERTQAFQADPRRQVAARTAANLVFPGLGAVLPDAALSFGGSASEVEQGVAQTLAGAALAPVLEQFAPGAPRSVQSPLEQVLGRATGNLVAPGFGTVAPTVRDAAGAALKGGGTFTGDALRQGLPYAVSSAQNRWEHAPEAFPAEKFLLEQAVSPSTFLTAGTGAALKGGATGLRAAQAGTRLEGAAGAIARALEVLGSGAGVYDDAARAVVQGTVGTGSRALRAIPINRAGEGLGDLSTRAVIGRQRNADESLLRQVTQDAEGAIPEGQALRYISAPYQMPKDRDIIAQVQQATSNATPAKAIRSLLGEFHQDFNYVDSALNYLRERGRALPNTLAEFRQNLDPKWQAPEGVLDETLARFRQEHPDAPLRLNEAFTTVLDDVLQARAGAAGQTLENNQRWDVILQFLERRYGDGADALLPHQRYRAAEAIQGRLAAEAPAPVAGGATATAPPPAPTIPAPTPTSTDPLRAQLEALAGRRLQEMGERFGTRYRWPDQADLPSRVTGLDRARTDAQQALQQLGLEDLPWDQALQQAQRVTRTAPLDSLERKAAERLQQYGKRYGGLDIRATADEDRALLTEYFQQLQSKLDPQRPATPVLTGLGRAWDEVTSAWRQQALLAPAYHVMNATDAYLKSLVLLGNGGHQDLGGVVSRAWRRTRNPEAADTLGLVAETQFAAGGIPRPAQLLASTQTQQEVRGVKGFERVPGLRGLVRLNREVGNAIEESFRTGAYLQGYRQYAAQNVDTLASALPAAARDEVVRRQGLLTPKELRTLVEQAGGDDAAVTQAYQALGRFRGSATDAGLALSNKVHFNYQDTTNLDEMLRQVTGFHFFATRNIPLYAEILATHPALARALNGYDRTSEEMARQEGVAKAKRYEQALPVGGAVGQTLARVLFGREGQIFVNPARYISIMGQVFANPQSRRNESAVGQALDVTQQAGVGIHPLASIGLAPTGLFGAQQPQNLFRLEPLAKAGIQAATGTVPQTPLDAYQRLRLPGQENTAPSDPHLPVRLRLSEMSLERYPDYARQNPGAPIHPTLVAAMVAGPQHPLWQEAARDLGDVAVRERIASLLGAPVQFHGEQAGRIARAQRDVPEANADQGPRGLDPVVPRGNARPGEPLVTPALRTRELQRRAAAGQPEALAYQEAFQAGGREPRAAGGSNPSVLLRQAILAEWQTASPAHRTAMLQDPLKHNVILQAWADNLRRPAR